MMESRTPPPVVPPCEAGDPEVSSQRDSLNLAFKKGHRMSPAPSGARSEELKDLLERASILEEHHALMDMVIGRISSTESGLHEAARSL